MKIALIHRDNPRVSAGNRMVGWWSYDVPEFEVTHYPKENGFLVKTSEFEENDLIFHEDGKLYGVIRKDKPIPVVYHVVDSTLSEKHYQTRIDQARLNADMVAVDFDRLDRFATLNMPTFRFGYCVNDKLFYDRLIPKTVDVGVFHRPTDGRDIMVNFLKQHCKEKGYSLEVGKFDGEDYAKALSRCKVVVNLNRNPETRSHRIFDAMASNTCMLTSPPPDVSDEARLAGRHYLEWHDYTQLGRQIDWAIQENGWRRIARLGYKFSHRHHTWAVRAKYLHQKLTELLFNV